MPRVLVVATSRKTRGGITSVIKAHETGDQWKKYKCVWIQTHRDGPAWRKILYLLVAWVEFLFLLPFSDVVHCHCPGNTSAKRKLYFSKVAKSFRKKVIIHFHPPGPHDVFEEPSHSIVEKLFSYADKVIVLSPQWERWIRESYPDKQYPMEVLWNPCPTVKRSKDPRDKQILYAGTIIKRKGYDVLLKGWAKIAKKYPDWIVAFAGNGEIEEGKKLASELGIESQVKWLGWISGDAKDQVFNKSSVYCLASTGEGFPMGVLDAWAYGIPCVMTPVGGIPDIVEDGVSGLIFPVGNVDVLAEKLNQILSDEVLRQNIVKESDKWVYEEFNVKNVTDCLGELYASVLAIR